MKKIAVSLVLLAWGIFLFSGTVVLVTPGPISPGSEVHFRFDHEGGAPDASYNWNYGDGSTEVTANNQGHHVYGGAGTFTVTCMLTHSGGPPQSGTLTVTVVDNRRISPQGSGFRQGQRVEFRSENFPGSNLIWNFGDGTVEPGPRNHGHSYANPGNFQVKAYEAGGSESTAVSCTVQIEPDNRQLTASTLGPRANQPVSFSAQNFPGGGLRWDFGDGTVENGGPSMSHVFRQPGSFQVRVWETARAPEDAVALTIAVAPDSRQLQANPSPPRAGTVVQLAASNFAGGSLRWDLGDGTVENGGTTHSHVYRQPGSVQVRVWEESEGQESALSMTLSVQPDVRQVALIGQDDVFEGSEIAFEARNFASPSLQWDFGDGVVERGGLRQPHRFRQSGSYLVKAVEADSGNLPRETRVQVLHDDRSLVVRSSVVFAGSEFEIEARGFRGSAVHWDFGDGSIQTGPPLMRHRYAQTGQFRVRAVDFAGRDGKSIDALVQVENDARALSLPAEVIAGEEVAMQLQNAGAGSFLWKFSDGESRSGADLRAKVFRSPGPHKVTVSDPSGHFPPLEKTVLVVPDNRSLRASAAFILPKESVTFTAAQFRGPGIRWDFGDGTVKENGMAVENHAYQALGRYKVKAVDFGGRSSKPFTADVVVAEMTPGFEVSSLELTFDNGKYYRVVAKNGAAPRYQLRVKAKGRAVLSGQLLLDSQSLGLFQLVVQENQVASLPANQMVPLPVIDLGLHELTFRFSNYSFNRRLPVIKYFVSAGGSIELVAPAIDAKVPLAGKVELRWSSRVRKPTYEIAVSDTPLPFLDERQVEWRSLGSQTSFSFDPSPYQAGDWIYWQVRVLNEGKQLETISEIYSFKLVQ